MVDENERLLPGTTPRALAEKQARAAREAAALRDNLHRRKQQARARTADAKAADAASATENPGVPSDRTG